MEDKTKKYAGSIRVEAPVHDSQASLDTNTISVSQLNPQLTSAVPKISIAVNRKKSDSVSEQACWYIVAFLMTYLFDLVASCMYYVQGNWNYTMDIFTYCVFLPLAGKFIETRPGFATLVSLILFQAFSTLLSFPGTGKT
jgi:hypothetical protein